MLLFVFHQLFCIELSENHCLLLRHKEREIERTETADETHSILKSMSNENMFKKRNDEEVYGVRHSWQEKME